MSYRIRLLSSACFVLVALLLPSCTTTQHGATSGKTHVCQECYDTVNAARTGHPPSGATHNMVIRTYECPCCKSEMSVYIENGVHMVKCGGCAADGVAWNKCTPSPHEAK
jgi:hypothetical protein